VRTKIVCTTGPSVTNPETLSKLIEAGMSVARLNFSHGTHEEHHKTIELIKEARRKKDKPLAIMLDTKGPEIRVYDLSEAPLKVTPKMRVQIVKDKKDASSQMPYLHIHPEIIVDHLKVGMKVLIDDGYIQGTIVECLKDKAILEILNPGAIKIKKSLNLPEIDFHLPILSEEDVADLTFGAKEDVDLIALSFVSSADQVLTVRKLLKDLKTPNTLIISKIESAAGVKNFDAILSVSDGIMVARGDLGVELPIEQIPKLQKAFVSKCLDAGKPVIIATQMLESMIQNPRPTRAEASDVAGAIYDAASAVMLSGETAVGAYPIETVLTMRRIIEETESAFNYESFFYSHAPHHYFDVTQAISFATVNTTYSTRAMGIVACTHFGSTARLISKFRPKVPLFAVTPDPKTYQQLALIWGVIPILANVKDISETIQVASQFAMEHKLLQYGDRIVVTAGSLFGVSGSTNMLIIENIGDVLVRGQPMAGATKIYGQVTLVQVKQHLSAVALKNKIVVLSSCDSKDLKLFEAARGVVLQNHSDDMESEKAAFEIATHYQIPLVVKAEGAFEILKQDQFVTLDPKKGLVFKGSVVSEKEEMDQIFKGSKH
jgi:pyruvate kinase